MVPPWPGLPVRDRIVVLAYHFVSGPAQAHVVAAPPVSLGFTGKQVHWRPRVYEPNSYALNFVYVSFPSLK